MTTNTPRIDETDWSTLTVGERIRHIEVEGFAVFPDLLSPDYVARLKAETALLKTRSVDYSEHQQIYTDLQYCGGDLADLVAHEPAITFLIELLGEEMQVMDYVYARCDPGFPGVSLHTDGGMPYGSKFFGYEVSVPVTARVLYYLDDLTPEVSPFRIVPRSHLSMHAEANPYLRYEAHPEEVMVPLTAGSAVITNYRVLHGNYPNVGDRSREMLALSYRPAWAGPIDDVKAWDPDAVAGLPAAVRPFFADRNKRYWAPDAGNKPEKMASAASGINPSRWDRKA